jgi:hypothetical protein
VDVLRSCYSSEWQLPTVGLVKGQFFFNDQAAFYGDWSYFGSRNYHQGDGTQWPPYGETEEAKQHWRNGSFPGTRPEERFLGTAAQIEGEAPNTAPTWDTRLGVPLPCWSEPPMPAELIVQEVDLVPTVQSVSIVQFDSLTGLRVIQPSTGVARVSLDPSTDLTPGSVNALTQAFLGTDNAQSALFSDLRVCGSTSGQQFPRVYLHQQTLALSSPMGYGQNAPIVHLHGAGGALALGLGVDNSATPVPTFLFGGTPDLPFSQFRIWVRTGLNSYADGMSGTIDGLSFVKGLLVGGGVYISSGQVSDFHQAASQDADASVAHHVSLADPHPQYAETSETIASINAAIASHVAEADPHPIYLTQVEGDARYQLIGATSTSVGLTGPAEGIAVSGSPVVGSGTMSLSLRDDLAALEGMAGIGLACRTGTSAWAARTLIAGTGLSLSNPQGILGNPTIGIAAANQVEVVQGLSSTKPITPLNAKWIPGAAKFWVNFDGRAGGVIRKSFNVTSFTRMATGDYLITIQDDFSTANYCVVGSALFDSATWGIPQSAIFSLRNSNVPSAGSVRVCTLAQDGTAVDCEIVNVVGYGEQA